MGAPGGIKAVLFKNLGAGAWGKISIVLTRVAQVPFLLWLLGVDDFGRWTVLYSLPSWLNLTNLGFGSVAANEMTMAAGAGDVGLARTVFSTTTSLIIGIGIIGTAVIAGIVPFVPWEGFLHTGPGRHQEMTLAAGLLGLSIFITFFYDVSLGRFRAAQKTHQSVLIASFFPWLDLAGLVVASRFSHRFDVLAMGMLGSTIVCCIVYVWLSRRAFPGISFSFAEIDKKRYRGLFRKGIAFQSFTLGNALMFQGNIMVIQLVLGPAAVALFSTARTLVRTVNQTMELVNSAIWPELSRLFGAGDFPKAARLHRNAVGISVMIAMTGVLFLALFGQPVYRLWVGKSLHLPEHLLLLFLLPIPFNALWYTSSVVHMATNHHEGLAMRFLLATGLSVIACAFLAYFFGLEGAALSTLLADVVLIPYVVRQSITLTRDTRSAFLPGVIEEIKGTPFVLKKFIYAAKKSG
jgi:O-antigen/teichoic acid export membrane protein